MSVRQLGNGKWESRVNMKGFYKKDYFAILLFDSQDEAEAYDLQLQNEVQEYIDLHGELRKNREERELVSSRSYALSREDEVTRAKIKVLQQKLNMPKLKTEFYKRGVLV